MCAPREFFCPCGYQVLHRGDGSIAVCGSCRREGTAGWTIVAPRGSRSSRPLLSGRVDSGAVARDLLGLRKDLVPLAAAI